MATQESKLIISLLDRLSGPAKQVSANMSALTAAARRNAQAMDRVRTQMFDAVAVGYALARSISAPIRASIDFESKMADIKKVVDFESPAAFKQMGDDIRELSLRIPVAADGLADIMAAAGQGGIDKKDLLAFTETAAKVSTAWDIAANEAGDALAKLKTATGRTVEGTASLADAINYLSDKTAASSRQILDFTKSVAPIASTFGFTAEQSSAIGSAMIGAGFGADIAGTSFKNMGLALTAGTTATKGQRDGLKRLGLNAKQVSKSMQVNAVGTLDDVLSRIRKLPKEAQASTMTQIFGKEAQALAPLLTNAKLLTDSIALVADKTKYAGSVQTEFETRSKTTANALQLFRNRLNDTSISIGEALTPGLNKALDVLGPLVTQIKSLATAFPNVVAGIVTTTAALVAFRIAMLALRFSGLFVAAGIIATSISFASLGAALAPIGAALTAVGAALATITAPVWLAIAVGVAAVAAAGSAMYVYWDRISATVSGVATAIGAKLEPVLKQLQPLLDTMRPVLDAFGSAFAAIGTAVGTAWTKIKEFFSGFSSLFDQEILSEADKNKVSADAFAMTTAIIDAFLALPAKLYEAGAQAIQGLWDGMVSKFNEFIAWVQTIPSQIAAAIGNIDLSGMIKMPSMPSWLGGGGDTPAKTDATPKVDGARAKGGPVSAGKTYAVGERGVELFTPNQSGFITPNDLLKQTAQSRSAMISNSTSSSRSVGDIHLTNYQTISGVSDPRAAAAQSAQELGRRVKSAVESAHTD